MLACGREERPFRSTRQTGASGTGCRGLRALQRPRSWLGCQVLTRVTGSPPTPPATCERGYGWRGPRLPPGPWSEVAEERQRVFCRVQVPTRLCWPPRPSAGRQPFITASAGSSPRHSCLSHSPPAGSPSATSGVPRPRTRRLAHPPVTCSRQVAVGLGLGGHTSSHASSSPVKEMNFLEPWGGGRNATSLPVSRGPVYFTSYSHFPDRAGRSAVDSKTHTPGCFGRRKHGIPH